MFWTAISLHKSVFQISSYSSRVMCVVASALTVGGMALATAPVVGQCNTLQDLGTFQAIPAAYKYRAEVISGDGKVIFGRSIVPRGDGFADWVFFRWTEEGGMEPITSVPYAGEATSSTTKVVFATNDDGTVVVGRNHDGSVPGGRVWRWTAQNGLQYIGDLGNPNNVVLTAVSGDCKTIAGIAFQTNIGYSGFIWTESGGMQVASVPTPPNFTWSEPVNITALSKDGAQAVGWGRLYNPNTQEDVDIGFRWTIATGVVENLGQLSPQLPQTRPTVISSDGTTIAGVSQNGVISSRAFRWTAAGGIQAISPSSGTVTFASNDGSVLAGYISSNFSGQTSFYWTTTLGYVDLTSSIFAGYPGTVTNTNITGMSADGSVIVGFLGGTGNRRAFRWTPQSRGMVLGDASIRSKAQFVTRDGLVAIGDFQDQSGSFFAFRTGDADGDGILDEWECYGVPYKDSNGNYQRYMLDIDGDGISDASPYQKDVFVEVDGMNGRVPDVATLQRVVDAFDPPSGEVLVDPPAGLVGGLPNVKLHIQMDPPNTGDSNLALQNNGDYSYSQVVDDYFVDFKTDKSQYFGTAAERNGPDWGNGTNSRAKREAKRQVFRYCIFANTYDNYSDSSGIAEGLPSDDFMVTLGHMTQGQSTWGTLGGNPDQQAGTFMHELGHTLGLHHGGGVENDDDVFVNGVTIKNNTINYKPNYYSIMNYSWQFPCQWMGTSWGLRYSTSALPDLDENALDESAGLSSSFVGVQVQYRDTGSLVCQSRFRGCNQYNPNVCFYLAPMSPNSTVDWNCDCNNSTLGVVTSDINDFHEFSFGNSAYEYAENGLGKSALLGHHDWPNLQYNFRMSDFFAAGQPVNVSVCNYTSEIFEFFGSAPELLCDSIDFNNDTSLFDPQDIEAFLSVYSEGPCIPVTATCNDIDFNNDESVFDPCDINSFLRVYAEGPCTPCGQ